MNFENINPGCANDEGADVNALRQGLLAGDKPRLWSANGSTPGRIALLYGYLSRFGGKSMNTNPIPALEGVEHRFIDLGGGVTIHVADAGPADGPPVMLVHGFPQNWWEWHELIGPLAADGYRVLCPDLRGAGWSSAPADRYRKVDMADDLAAVLARLDVGPVRLVAHDWGGPVAVIMTLRHPEKVSGFFGVNTVGPWLTPDLAHAPPLMAILVSDPDVDPGAWAAELSATPRGATSEEYVAGPVVDSCHADFDVYIRCMARPDHAEAGSRWYRTFQNREAIRWLRGEYANARFDIPVRWLHGMSDPVVTPTLFRATPIGPMTFGGNRRRRRSLDRRTTARPRTRPTPRVPARNVRPGSQWNRCGRTGLRLKRLRAIAAHNVRPPTRASDVRVARPLQTTSPAVNRSTASA